METSRYVRVDGRLMKLTHLEKPLYPSGFRKADVIEYYRRISPIVLPYLHGRPFTLKRFPDGVGEGGFYEKSCPSHRPGWMQTGELGGVRYCLINDLPSLLWAANLAAVELHVTLARIGSVECPSFMVFDLDPGDGTGIPECAEAALWVRDLLAKAGLESYPKTSGQKGLHVYVPLNSETDYRHSREWSRRVAEALEARYPDKIVSRMAKKLRAGKIFIDWSQNDKNKTTVCAYSLRSAEKPTVSTPLSWREVLAARNSSSKARELASIGPEELFRRIDRFGDLFEPVRSRRQELPPLSAIALPRLRLKAA